MSDEIIQVVDKNDKPVGSSSKTEAWEKGLIRRLVRIMIEDKSGRILLQKRHPNKYPYPGRWDNSVAGHVDENETYLDAANRELAEELGLHNLKLEEVGKYYSEGRYEWRNLKGFVKVYKTTIDVSRQSLKLHPNEVTDTKWFTVDEIKALAKDSEKISGGLKQVIERYY